MGIVSRRTYVPFSPLTSFEQIEALTRESLTEAFLEMGRQQLRVDPAALRLYEDGLLHRVALHEPMPHLFEPVEELEIVHVGSEVEDPGFFEESLYIGDGREGIATGEGTVDVGSDENLLGDPEISTDETGA